MPGTRVYNPGEWDPNAPGVAGLGGANVGASEATVSDPNHKGLTATDSTSYNHVHLPSLQDMLATASRGQTPKLVQSQAANARGDMQGGAAQNTALDQLRKMYTGNMTTPQDQARMSQEQGFRAQDANGRAGALQNKIQMRGGAPRSNILAANIGGPGASENAFAYNNQNQAQLQQRALQALSQAGTQAGQMRNASFQQGLQTGNARDAISNFNANMQTQVGLGNVNRANTVGQFNAGQPVQQAQMGQQLTAARVGESNRQGASAQAAEDANMANDKKIFGGVVGAATTAARGAV